MKLYIRTLNPLVVSMYAEGKTLYDIAEVFDVSHVAVWKALKDAGIEMRGGAPEGPQKSTLVKLQRIREQRAVGVPDKAIAGQLGITEPHMKRLVRKYAA